MLVCQLLYTACFLFNCYSSVVSIQDSKDLIH